MKTDSNGHSNCNIVTISHRLPTEMRLSFVVGAIAAIAAGLFGCNTVNENPSVAPQQISNTIPVRRAEKIPVIRLPQRREAALKKAITTRLNLWKASIEARDINKHLQHYADRIETYYTLSDVDKDFVQTDRRRAFEKFETLKVEMVNIDITFQADDAATVTFDKAWDFRNATDFSNGLVQQEVRLRNIENRWLIISEKDLQIYRYRNDKITDENAGS